MSLVLNPIVRLSPNQAENEYFALARMWARSVELAHSGIKQWQQSLVLANGVVITYRCCYGAKNIYISVPEHEVSYTEEIKETLPRGFLAHARKGLTRWQGLPGTDLLKTKSYAISHLGNGYSIVNGILQSMYLYPISGTITKLTGVGEYTVSCSFQGISYPVVQDDSSITITIAGISDLSIGIYDIDLKITIVATGRVFSKTIPGVINVESVYRELLVKENDEWIPATVSEKMENEFRVTIQKVCWSSSGSVPYPLVDDDEKTWLFSKNDNEWATAPVKVNGKWSKDNAKLIYGKTSSISGIEYPKDLNYGNIDWKGPVTANPKDRIILTYRGNPSRYWAIGQFVELPGFTNIDHKIDGLSGSYQYTTVFGDKVYRGGKVFATMPWLYHPLDTIDGVWQANHQNAQVLGAAIRSSDGVLICIVKTCYNSYPDVKPVPTELLPGLVSTWQVWKSGELVQDWYGDEGGARNFVLSKPSYNLVEVTDPGRGYWIEVIVQKKGDIQGGWKRLLRIPVPGMSMPPCNFFFNQSGSKACSVFYGYLYIISIEADIATYTKEEVGVFKQKIEITNTKNQTGKYGEQESWATGVFGAVYRKGLEVGDWINKQEMTSNYKSTKSGSIILAADYKADELVKMTVTISGSETVDEEGYFGKKWGYTALPQSSHTHTYSDYNRRPGIRIDGDPMTEYQGWTYDVQYSVSGCCKCKVTLNGVDSSTPCGSSGGRSFLANPCVPPGNAFTLIAKATDGVTGRYATHTKTYLITVPMGIWTTTNNVVQGDPLYALGSNFYVGLLYSPNGKTRYNCCYGGGTSSALGNLDVFEEDAVGGGIGHPTVRGINSLGEDTIWAVMVIYSQEDYQCQ